jgi:hypothetical protein
MSFVTACATTIDQNRPPNLQPVIVYLSDAVFFQYNRNTPAEHFSLDTDNIYKH